MTASFLDAGLVDEAIVYVAPTLLGAGHPALDGGGVGTLHGRPPRPTAGRRQDRTRRRLRFDFRR